MSQARLLKTALLTAIIMANLGLAAIAQGLPAQPQATGDLGRLQSLESQFFGHTNDTLTIFDRLNKIETQVFGQAGDGAMNGRLNRLEAALGKAPQPTVTATSGTVSGKPAKNKVRKQDDDFTPTFSRRPPISGTLTPLPPISMLTPELMPMPTPGAPAKETFQSISAEAVDDYKAQRYHACCEKLMKAVTLKPTDAVTYYRLGDVLTILRDDQGAKEAYSACFKIDPFGPVGKMARSKVLGFAQRDMYTQFAPQDTPTVVAHTINQIDRQTADIVSRYNQEGQSWADWRTRLGAIEAQKIQNETSLRLAEMRGMYNGYRSNYGYYGRSRGYGSTGAASAYDQREISNLGQINSSYQRTDAQVQGNKARIEAAGKATSVTESAANLKDLMMAPYFPGDAKLKALGTNLYVRYYGDDTPSYDLPPVPEDPIQELRAKALRLSH